MASNEGNDAAAGRAFQVGDRVYISDYRSGRPGTVVEPGAVVNNGNIWVRVHPDDSMGSYDYRDTDLTLISRATPAPAPAQPAPERNSFAMTMPCQFGKHGECDGTLRVGNVATPDVVSSPCECECHQHSEPATPAPAQTTPAMDTHTLELPVMLPCPHCHGTGTFHGTSLGRCQGCDGDGWSTSTIRLSDEAVDRLAGALAKRMRSVAR